jgi:excisionase family DNA binding protein
MSTETTMDTLLTVEQAAEVLGTSVRFPRRLTAERRITFVPVGRHVRIPAAALVAFVEASTVHAAVCSNRWMEHAG